MCICDRTHHSHSSDNDPLEHGFGLEKSLNSDELQLENVPSSLLLQMREVLSCASLLEQRLGLDLEELQLDQLVVLGEVSEIGEDLPSFLLPAMMNEPTRGEWHPNHSHEENNSGAQLQADRNEPSGI